MFHAETIVAKASADEDYRLQLMAIDRVRGALELTMKAIGQIGGDGSVAVNVVVDNRRKLEAWFADLGEAQVRRLTEILAQGIDVHAVVAGDAQPALTSGEIGTPLRDETSL